MYIKYTQGLCQSRLSTADFTLFLVASATMVVYSILSHSRFATSCEVKLTRFASHEDVWGSGSIKQFLPLALLKVSDQLHAPNTSPLGECSLYLWMAGPMASQATLLSGGMPNCPVCNWGQLTQLFTIRGSTVTCSDLISMADNR
jgi:hypothetical protein